MTDMFTGMPFYWQGGGGGGLGGLGGNAATGQPAMSSSQINASMGWNPYASFNPFANTPGGFGGQTDYYSNLGAAFGRQTGGFNASPGYPSGNVQRGADLPAPDTSGYDPLGGGTPPGYNPFDSSTYGMLLGGWGQPQPQAQPQASSGGGIGSDALRDRFAWQLAQSSPYATPQHAPQTSGMPNLGYNPGMSNWFANFPQSTNSVADRFQGGGYYQPGQPSQYYGGYMPPSFQQPFSFDRPGGALPLGGGGGGPGVYQNDPFGGLTGAGG
jgi:hypothetical protein